MGYDILNSETRIHPLLLHFICHTQTQHLPGTAGITNAHRVAAMITQITGNKELRNSLEKDKALQPEITKRSSGDFKIVAVAASAGGLSALTHVLGNLPSNFPVPIVVVQHLAPAHRSLIAEIMSKRAVAEHQAGAGG